MMTDFLENLSGIQENDLDWENRKLCSDDSCIGIIGTDGRCRVCGLPDSKAHVGSDQYNSRSADPDESPEPSAEVNVTESEEIRWENRKLCSDESCIGTIGADGRCRICGLTG